MTKQKVGVRAHFSRSIVTQSNEQGHHLHFLEDVVFDNSFVLP